MAEVKGGQQLENVLRAIASKLKGGVVRVGFLEGSTYPDGTPVAQIAAIQEYGAPKAGIPPRPFFRNMIKQNAADWPRRVGNVLQTTDGDTERALNLIGEAIAGQLRESIVRTNEPPLADSTIARKGFAKPLVDTGHMLASIDYEVEIGDETSRGSDRPDSISDADWEAYQNERQRNLRRKAIG